MPLIRRLRRGKLAASGAVPSGNSESTSPRASSSREQRGVAARVDDVDAIAEHRDARAACPASPPRCAAASIPSASPLTMQQSGIRDSAREVPRHCACPAPWHCGCRRWRSPFSASNSMRPAAYSTGGGSASRRSSCRIAPVVRQRESSVPARAPHASAACSYARLGPASSASAIAGSTSAPACCASSQASLAGEPNCTSRRRSALPVRSGHEAQP